MTNECSCYRYGNKKESTIQKTSVTALFCIVALILGSFCALAPLMAHAEDTTCKIKAYNDKVYVVVRAADKEDNELDEIWSGSIDRGKEQMIQCETGRIIISSRRAEPGSTLQRQGYFDCKNGNMLRVIP